MNTKAYTYLIAIEENKSLSKAAEKLGVSQPALSKFLANAENTLGHQLFMKNKKSLIPTDAGKIYLKACRQIINIKQQTYSSIAMLNEEPKKIITLGLTPYRGSQIFSYIFPKFTEKYPHIEIRLREGYMQEIKKDVDKGIVDLVIGTMTPADERIYNFASTSYEQLCIAVPLSHPSALKSNDSGDLFPVIDIHTLSDAPFVMWGYSTTNSKIIDEYMARNHFNPTVVYRGNNALMVNEMLKTGIGVGFLPKSFCKAHEGRVYFSTWPPVQSFNGIFFKKSKILSEAENYLIYLMMKHTAETCNNSGMNVYFNKLSRTIINEFEGQNIL